MKVSKQGFPRSEEEKVQFNTIIDETYRNIEDKEIIPKNDYMQVMKDFMNQESSSDVMQMLKRTCKKKYTQIAKMINVPDKKVKRLAENEKVNYNPNATRIQPMYLQMIISAFYYVDEDWDIDYACDNAYHADEYKRLSYACDPFGRFIDFVEDYQPNSHDQFVIYSCAIQLVKQFKANK